MPTASCLPVAQRSSRHTLQKFFYGYVVGPAVKWGFMLSLHKGRARPHRAKGCPHKTVQAGFERRALRELYCGVGRLNPQHL